MCGIGGRTVAEAKTNISYVEFVNWRLYRNKYGCLHAGMRIDRAVSRAATLFANMLAKKNIFESMDLSPYDKAIEEENEPEVTAEQAFAALSAAAKSKGVT